MKWWVRKMAHPFYSSFKFARCTLHSNVQNELLSVNVSTVTVLNQSESRIQVIFKLARPTFPLMLAVSESED